MNDFGPPIKNPQQHSVFHLNFFVLLSPIPERIRPCTRLKNRDEFSASTLYFFHSFQTAVLSWSSQWGMAESWIKLISLVGLWGEMSGCDWCPHSFHSWADGITLALNDSVCWLKCFTARFIDLARACCCDPSNNGQWLNFNWQIASWVICYITQAIRSLEHRLFYYHFCVLISAAINWGCRAKAVSGSRCWEHSSPWRALIKWRIVGTLIQNSDHSLTVLQIRLLTALLHSFSCFLLFIVFTSPCTRVYH